MKMRDSLALGLTLLVMLGGPALGQDAGTPDKDQVVQQPKPYSPYVDQHLHNSNLSDGVMFAETRQRPGAS